VKDDDIKTKPSLIGVENSVTLELSTFYAAVSRHDFFPELSYSYGLGALQIERSGTAPSRYVSRG
jgi:hypothetical protein